MVGHLDSTTLETHQPVCPLHLTGEHQLGDDRFDGHALFEHDLDERLAHPPQRRGESLLDGQVEHGLLFGGEFNGALAQPTDGLGHGEHA